MTEIEYIKSKIPKPELLAALAEECSELAQAALKLRRVLDGSNPTPFHKGEAMANLMEEYGDVLNCVEAILTPKQKNIAMLMRQDKMTRWAKRIKEENG